MNPEYGSKEQDLSATIGNTERGKRVMKRGRRFLAFLLAALLAAGSLQAPAISLMTAVPVFAADAAEAETAETDAKANANADQDLGETSSMEDEQNANAVGDSSLTDTADEAAPDSADANEEISGQDPAEPTEEEWQEDEPAEADPAAEDTQEDGFEMETGREQEAESALSNEDRNGGETQTTEPAETSVNDTENGTVSDDLSAAQEAASETGTELTPEQIRAFQEKVRIWKDGNRISMVYASTEDIRLAYSIYPGVEDLAETLDDPLYSGVLGWDDESGLYYEAVDFDAVNEADAGRDLPQIDIRDIPVCVVIEDGLNHYVESVGAAPGGVEIESAELNDGNIDIAWDGGDADGYAVIVRGSGVDIYDSTSPEISISASESEEYVIEVSAYAYDENAGIMQFGEAGSRELMLSEGSQNEANDETPTPDDAQTASAGESKNTDEAASKDPEEQEKVLTEPGNRKTVSSDAMMDAVESGTCGENLTWTLDSDGVLTISGTGEMEDYWDISYVSPWYSSRSSIKSIIINKGVTSIGTYAFYECNALKNITLPQTLRSIGRGAFYFASGPSVLDLPVGIITIGDYAFGGMDGLEKVTVPDSVVTLGLQVFYICNDLKSVTLGNGLTELPNNTFYNDDSLERVILPQNLERIGTEAFYFCTGLSQIAIPDSVKVIDDYAFYNCKSLTEITLPASLECLGGFAFQSCKSLHTVVMPDQAFEAGENVFAFCPNTLQFLDKNGQVLKDIKVGEETPHSFYSNNSQNYTTWNNPRHSYLIDDGTQRLLITCNGYYLIREHLSEEGDVLLRKNIPFELPIFGGFYAGKDSYFLVFGQNNDEEDDEKEVIRIVRYSKEWVRQGAASICGENTTIPFDAGTVSLTETAGILYMRTAHEMYTSEDDGKRHQANLTAVIRESDMTVSWIFSKVWNISEGYVSHSFNQIVKTDGMDLLAADHGDAIPRGITLFRYAGKAGAETLDRPEYLMVFPFAGKIGDNNTGASMGALEASSSHYLVVGNSVLQDEDSYDPSGVRNIFVTATPKNNFTSSATEFRWLTSYSGNEEVSTPVMTALPDGRFLLMWTVDEILNYCFLAADGSRDGGIYTGNGSLSDCEPYVKDNSVWWCVSKSSAPIYYSISLDAPYKIHIHNPGHTVFFDPAGGRLEDKEMEVTHWSKYGELPVPEREAGYEFLGWYTGKNYGTQVTSSSDVRIRASETLYAHWLQHWSFSEETGTLRILKKGDMKDYSAEWSELKDRVKRVEIAPGVTSIRYNAFKEFTSLKSITIPEGVASIGSCAFQGCSSLERITIPAGLTDIGISAFSGCSSLGSVSILDDVTTIRNAAFSGCTSLKSITIPAGGKIIGDLTFSGCTSLENVTISVGVTSIQNGAFQGCTSLKNITIPAGVISIGNAAFADCTALESIMIPDSVTDIRGSAFNGCTSLKSITIPAGVISIGNYAFEDCTSLKSILIPPSVKSIGNYAFKDCTALKNITISDGMTSIGRWAFSYCEGLTSIIIPDSVTEIEDFAFHSCSNLKYVTIPASVENIGEYAFVYCHYNLTICGIPGTYAEQYAKEKNIPFRDVNKQYLEDATVTGLPAKTYTGKAITQTPVVKIGDATLVSGTDYSLSYSNNTNAGTATVTITGKGNYTGTKTATFKINKAAQNISVKSTAASLAVGRAATVSITGSKGTKSYKSSNTAVATVTAAGRVTARKVGTVKITAASAATANYNAASKTVTIKVVPAATASIAAANQATGIKLTWKRVAGATGYKVYRGAALIRTIRSGATVTCTDTKANANGTKYIFKVIPYASTGNGLARSLTTYRVARPAVSSVKNSAAKKMTVKWGRNAKANGYQIQYSTSRTFASGNKAVIVAGAANVSRVIGGLVKGKTYYVRIRTYKTVGKARYWSIWSPAKSVKIAK